MTGLYIITFYWLGFLTITVSAGQSVLKKPEITSLHVFSDVKYRFATTKVTSRVKNANNELSETVFDVTLPNEAFITNFTLDIDGKVIVGEIKEKEVAKQQYEAAQARGESAAYIGTQNRETNKFNLAVTVAPQSKVSFNLTYQELLKRKHGHYEQVIYIDPGQPVPEMEVTVAILESRNITNLRVPPLRNDISNIDDVSRFTAISQPTPNTAHVKFLPSLEYQTTQSAGFMSGQFVVQYDVEREMDAGDVLVVNGYFVHFFAPEGFTPIPNDVLFILDTSGSMIGQKLQQLKEAMLSIIAQLTDGDRINIMTFSGSTSFWKTEMVDIMDEDVREEATQFINSLNAGGFTDINLALTTGISFLTSRVYFPGDVRSPVIVFLTDGEATSGVTISGDIINNIKKTNEGDIPIFSLAFGKHADYDLVKKISIQNNGLGRKIYEASDAAMQIAGFYNEIAVTLLHNITFKYLDAPVENVTKHSFSNYFSGSEMIISGRVQFLSDPETPNLLLEITGDSSSGHQMLLTGLDTNLIDIVPDVKSAEPNDFEEITEKVWAYLTIKQLLDKELVATEAMEKQGLRRQIIDLSLQYGFVTPMTSMVVTLPTENERTKLLPSFRGTEPVRKTSVQMAQASMRAQSYGGRQYDPPQFPAGFLANVQPQHFPMPTGLGYPKIRHDDVDFFDSDTVVSKIGGPRKRRINKRKKKINKKKRSRKHQEFKFPLNVWFPNLPTPLCFNMYEASLDTKPTIYTLYNDTDVRVEVLLEKATVGKWIKQGAVREIYLISGSDRQTLTNKTPDTRDVSHDDSLPWAIRFKQSISSGFAVEIEVSLEAFNFTVWKQKDGALQINVKRSTQHGPLADSGILGRMMSQQVTLIKLKNKVKKKGHTRAFALLKFGQRRVNALERDVKSFKGKMEKCWSFKQPVEEMSAYKA